MPELAGVRVLVTGASGFIGSNLVAALLEAGADTQALVRSESAPVACQAREADLRDAEAVARAVAEVRPEVVLHLAAGRGHAGGPAERAAMLADTVVGTANLLEALRRVRPGRLVHVGSGLEYGPSPRPLRGNDVLRPVTFRGAAKAAASLLALELGASTDVEVVVLRPFSVYGPAEGTHRFVPTAVTAALRGEPVSVTSGSVGRDYVYVGDVVDACLAAATAPEAAGKVENVGTGRFTTNRELLDRLAVAAGRDLDVREGGFEHRPWEAGTWVADVTAAREELGWSPATGLDEGLARTLEWFADRETASLAGAGR